jgi:tRNA-dependent cyclodipeptide synthase
MIIKNIYNTTLDRIANKEHNIYVGISIGNKYFTKERVGAYLDWAIENSKNPPIIFLADTIQAYNYMAFKGYSEEDAIKTAKNHGKTVRNMMRKVINYRKNNNKNIGDIEIIGVDQIWKYSHKQDFLFLEQEFENNILFRETICNLITKMLPHRDLNEKNMQIAAKYLLSEIPIMHNLNHNGIQYDLYPYPSDIVMDFDDNLQNQKIFPEIASKLHMPKKICSIEAYVGE